MTPMRRAALEALRDDLAGKAPSPMRDTITHFLEVVIGTPEIDGVIDRPVAIWDKLRDVLTRLERVEADAHPAGGWQPARTNGAEADGQPDLVVRPATGTDRTGLFRELAGRIDIDRVVMGDAESAGATRPTDESITAESEAVDVFGNRLRVGTEVAYPNGGLLDTGVIADIRKRPHRNGDRSALTLVTETTLPVTIDSRYVCARP